MELENEEILHRLQEIEKILVEFSKIDPVLNASSLKLSIDEFRKQLSQNSIFNNLSALVGKKSSNTERLFSLEKECLALVAHRYEALANTHRFSPSVLLEQSSISPGEQLALILKDLKDKAVELNKKYQKQLNRKLKQLSNDSGRLIKAEELLSEIQEFPQRLSIPPYTIRNLGQAPRTRTVYIAEERSPQEERLDRIRKNSQSLNALFENHQKLAPKSQISGQASKDFILCSKLAALSEIDKKAEHLSALCADLLKQNKVSFTAYKPDYPSLKNLESVQEDALQKLMTLTTQKKQLHIQVDERYREISPENKKLDELVLSLQFARKVFLSEALVPFLSQLIVVSGLNNTALSKKQGFFNEAQQFFSEVITNLLGSSSKSVQLLQGRENENLFEEANQFIQRLLTPFVTAICKDLRSSDMSQTSESAGKLCSMIESLSINTPDKAQMKSVLSKLFDAKPSTFSKMESTLRNQIFALHNLGARIQSFSPNLELIKEYYSIQGAFPAGEQSISGDAEKIRMEKIELIIDLQNKLDLYSDDSKIKLQTNKANEIIRDWYTLGAKLATLLESHQKNTINYRKAFKSDTETLSSLTDATKLLSERQKYTINELQKLAEGHKELKEQATNVLLKLEEIYKNEKDILKNTLKKGIEEAQKALSFYNTVFKSSQKDIPTELAKEYEEFNALETAIANLSVLQDINNSSIERLQGHTTKVKTSINHKYKDEKESIIKKIEDFKRPLLHPANPLNAQLMKTINTANTQKKELKTHYNTLKSLTAGELSDWHTQFIANLSTVKDTIETRDKLWENAEILEKRLDSKAYKTSLEILVKFKEEYLRIIKGHLPVANQKQRLDSKMDQVELDELENKLAELFDKTDNLQQEEINLLNKIDPRLHTILSMQAEFKQINSDYINEDIDLCNDVNYIGRLLNQVNTQIHNKDTRESLSKDIRPEFIQWIRIHVFKPLQQLKHDASKLFSKEKTSNTFFVTLGASKTERYFVEFGNKVHKELEDIENLETASPAA